MHKNEVTASGIKKLSHRRDPKPCKKSFLPLTGNSEIAMSRPLQGPHRERTAVACRAQQRFQQLTRAAG